MNADKYAVDLNADRDRLQLLRRSKNNLWRVAHVWTKAEAEMIARQIFQCIRLLDAKDK